ncbi:MAG: metallophosphoesterase [Elusimicrobiales bacterium]|nr:metallophosphoesterase [Elusimicrobiales bacterium]HOL62345.1 metallophosphoesterase [Elusimicrobiales bacterium]HPO94482.1 metallophosphoesterase [Elusimicrobiales bacterium]
MKKFAFFFLLISAAYVYLHIYISNFFSKAGYFKNYSNKLFLSLALFSILTLFLRRKLEGSLYETAYVISFIWMGYVLMLSFFISAGYLLSFLNIEFKKIFIFVIFSSAVSLFVSFYNALKIPNFKSLDYKENGLNRNYKLVFMSDIHLDFSFKYKTFSKILDEILKIKPDILIIGGDLLDPGFKINEYVEKIKTLPFPVVFVFGNHEYYYGFDKSKAIAEKLRLISVKDSSFVFDRLNIIGISDVKTESLTEQDVVNIVSKEYKKGFLNILVSHQPLYFKEISDKFDLLMLSGHTHCGQIFPFHIFTKMAYPYFCGEHRNKNSFFYVSKGAGTWGPPLRFFSNSEIIVLNIAGR